MLRVEIRYGGFRSWPVGVKTGIITIGGSFAILSNVNVYVISTQQTLLCICATKAFACVGWPSVPKLVLYSTACNDEMMGYSRAIKVNV